MTDAAEEFDFESDSVDNDDLLRMASDSDDESNELPSDLRAIIKALDGPSSTVSGDAFDDEDPTEIDNTGDDLPVRSMQIAESLSSIGHSVYSNPTMQFGSRCEWCPDPVHTVVLALKTSIKVCFCAFDSLFLIIIMNILSPFVDLQSCFTSYRQVPEAGRPSSQESRLVRRSTQQRRPSSYLVRRGPLVNNSQPPCQRASRSASCRRPRRQSPLTASQLQRFRASRPLAPGWHHQRHQRPRPQLSGQSNLQ